MKISNLGILKKVDLELSSLMLFTGENNSGKTYTSYMLYGLLSFFKESDIISFVTDKEIDLLLQNGEIEILQNNIVDRVTKRLKSLSKKTIQDIALKNFKINESEFEKLMISITDSDLNFLFRKFRLNLLPNEIEVITVEDTDFHLTYCNNMVKIECDKDIDFPNKAMFKNFLATILSSTILDVPNVFYYPAERNGINVFKNELDEGRLKSFDTLVNTVQYINLKSSKEQEQMRQKLIKQNFELLLGGSGNGNFYPKPISDYINFLRTIKPHYYETSSNSEAQYIREEILKGKFEIDEQNNQVSFRQRHGSKQFKTKTIPFHVLSSSIKSLYGLDYYLDTQARSGDILIIDEPELSLHPENQIKLAKVLVDVVRSGIRVILSTHSDLLVRKLTNIALENELSDGQEGLASSDISIYNFDSGNVEKQDDVKKLTYFENFDKTIFELQEHYNNLLLKLSEKRG